MGSLSFVWLEITGKCQLECVHCYAESGPTGDHGAMGPDDWARVIEQVAGLGACTVQFIGGEPALHPALPALIEHALTVGLTVEVFSNLVHISGELWTVLGRPRVSLATSYYSDDPQQHAAITRRPTYARTKANVAEALRRSIPLRVGVIDVLPGQRADRAQSELRAMGVRKIDRDSLRHVGRGIRGSVHDRLAQLCGRCGEGSIAVAADGSVWPCVFSRWLPVGNVRDEPLAEIWAGTAMNEAAGVLRAHFAARPPVGRCDPQCGPNCGPACNPQCWPTGSGPCGPKGGCNPNYD